MTNPDYESSTQPPNDDVIDSSYGLYGKEENSYKLIVLRAIEECRKQWCKELTRGGRSSVFSKELNSWIPVTIPDQRKVNIQVTLGLKDLLIGKFDPLATKNITEIELRIKNSPNKFFNEYLIREYWQPYIEIAKRTGLIQTGEKSNVGHYMQEQFEDYVLECYRLLYQELITLFLRKNQLNDKITTDFNDMSDDD